MVIRYFVIFTAMFILEGCTRNPLSIYVPRASGGIYGDTIVPISSNKRGTVHYSCNYNNTKVGRKKVIVDRFKLEGSVNGLKISADWNVHQVVKEAKKMGLKNIHHIEERNFNILGVYGNKEYIVYGD